MNRASWNRLMGSSNHPQRPRVSSSSLALANHSMIASNSLSSDRICAEVSWGFEGQEEVGLRDDSPNVQPFRTNSRSARHS